MKEEPREKPEKDWNILAILVGGVFVTVVVAWSVINNYTPKMPWEKLPASASPSPRR